MRNIFVAAYAALLLLCSPSAARSADNQEIARMISGNWVGCFVSRSKPKNVSTVTSLRLVANGTNLNGAMDREAGGQGLDVQGEVSSGRVFFSVNGRTGSGSVYSAKFALSLKGSIMDGTVESGTFNSSRNSTNGAWFWKVTPGAAQPACPL